MKSHPDSTSHIQENPPIASPTLGRKANSKLENLEPHLHLMCDLLPCPHQDEYREKYSAVQVGGSNNISNGNESTQYKQYLEAERPNIDESTHSAPRKDGCPKDDTHSSENEEIVEKQIGQKPILKETPPRKDRIRPVSGCDTDKNDIQHADGDNSPQPKVKVKGQKENQVTEPLYSSSPKVRGGRIVSVDNTIGQVS